MNEYLCPTCYVRLEKNNYKLEHSQKLEFETINLFRGFCVHCRQPFYYFTSEYHDMSIFWSSEHEETLFKEVNGNRNNSINVLYLPSIAGAEEAIKKYSVVPTKQINIVYTIKDCLSLIDKLNVRGKNRVVLINDRVLDSKLNEDFPCILAERNIVFATSYFKEANIYSNDKNIFYKEKIKRL